MWDRLAQKRTPLSVTLEITARCNNKCRHCYINLPASDSQAKAEELSLDQILCIAGQAVEMGAMWCLVTGGEPLLRPDFAEIYLGLKRKGLLVGVFTNATLIQEQHIRLFKRYPPRDLEVTVYGITQATYEAVTCRTGSFADFQRGLQLLLKNGVPVRLKAMALRSNLHELTQIADFAVVTPEDITALTHCCTCATIATRNATPSLVPNALHPKKSFSSNNRTRNASVSCRSNAMN